MSDQVQHKIADLLAQASLTDELDIDHLRTQLADDEKATELAQEIDNLVNDNARLRERVEELKAEVYDVKNNRIAQLMYTRRTGLLQGDQKDQAWARLINALDCKGMLRPPEPGVWFTKNRIVRGGSKERFFRFIEANWRTYYKKKAGYGKKFT